MSSLFGQGLILGFAIAAPVGPIGALCIRRTLEHGRGIGLATGLGAAAADAAFGSLAALGLTSVSRFLVAQNVWLSLVGGVFLCGLGVRTMGRRPVDPSATSGRLGPSLGPGPAFASTFLLTLMNPMTILSFAAVFAGLGVGSSSGDFAAAGALVSGIFLGSAAWWLGLSTTVGLARTRVTPLWMRVVNVVSGLVILAGGGRVLVNA